MYPGSHSVCNWSCDFLFSLLGFCVVSVGPPGDILHVVVSQWQCLPLDFMSVHSTQSIYMYNINTSYRFRSGNQTVKIKVHWIGLVCMLSRFSYVRLFATSWTIACQAPSSMGLFSSRGSFRLRDWTCVSYISCTGRQVLYHSTT